MGTCELAIKCILFEMFSLREGYYSIKKLRKKHEATRNLFIITLYAFEGCKDESKGSIILYCFAIRLCNHFRDYINRFMRPTFLQFSKSDYNKKTRALSENTVIKARIDWQSIGETH